MDSDYFPVFVTINSTARFVNIFFNRIRLSRGDALRSGSQYTLRKLLRKLLWQFFLSLRKKITIPSSTASSLASAKNSTKSYSKTQHHNGESPSPGTPAGPLIPECNKAIRSSLSPFPSLSLKTQKFRLQKTMKHIVNPFAKSLRFFDETNAKTGRISVRTSNVVYNEQQQQRLQTVSLFSDPVRND